MARPRSPLSMIAILSGVNRVFPRHEALFVVLFDRTGHPTGEIAAAKNEYR